MAGKQHTPKAPAAASRKQHMNGRKLFADAASLALADPSRFSIRPDVTETAR
jgi:hypothetical protein